MNTRRKVMKRSATIVSLSCLSLLLLAQQPPARNPKASLKGVDDVLVMTGSKLGGIKLNHKEHIRHAADNCEVCHHESRPEKHETKAYQACRDCHTRPLPAGVKTSRQAAFHASNAQKGICIDCHKEQNAKGKKAPLKCVECHQKELRAAQGGMGDVRTWH